MSSQHDVVQQDAHAAAHGDDDSMFWLPWLHDRTVQPVYGCTTALCSWPTAMRSWYNQSSLLCICMHASAGQANNVTALALESDGLQPTLVENKPCIQHPVLAGPHGTGPGPPYGTGGPLFSSFTFGIDVHVETTAQYNGFIHLHAADGQLQFPAANTAVPLMAMKLSWMEPECGVSE